MKAKRSRKDSGDDTPSSGYGGYSSIPPEMDEDIDDDLAFDSEDEAKYGAFFASKGPSKASSKKGAGSGNKEEIEETFDRLNALGGSKGKGHDDDELGFSDDSRDEFDISEMLDSKDEKRDAREKRRLAKKSQKDSHVGRRSTVKEPLTMEAESLLGAADSTAARAGVRKLLGAAADAPATKRLQKSLANNKLLLTQDVDDITKDRADRRKVREVVEAQLDKYKTVLKQQQSTRHLAFPLRPQEAVCPVPVTLTGLVSAVQEGMAENRSDAQKRAAASTGMADRMNALLQASGLQKDERSSEPAAGGASEQFVPFDAADEEGGEDGASKPISVGYMQKLKSMMSFENAKRRRFNKIKSKTYRRILRKEKERDQERKAKAFELLHPEEARRRLQKKMDDMRAEERVTQKHKNTSKWVRHAKKFAKVDDETKDAIDEQHQLHARLMRKMEDDLADELNGAAVDDARADSSEEEDQAVDQLLAGGRVKSAKSVLWGDGAAPADDEALVDQTPVARARKELRAMAFMQRAEQRHAQQMDEDLEAMEADIREYQETGELARAAAGSGKRKSKSKAKQKRDADGSPLGNDDDDDALLNASDRDDALDEMVPARSRGGKKATDGAKAQGRRQFGSDKKAVTVALGTKSGLSAATGRGRDGAAADGDDAWDSAAPEEIVDNGQDDLPAEAAEKLPSRKKARTEGAARPAPSDGFAGDRNPEGQPPTKKEKCPSTRLVILPKAAVAPVAPVDADTAAIDQDYLVARAFANDDVDEEFLALKSKQVEDIMRPADKNASLPGWGEWGGTSERLNVAHQARVAQKDLERRIEKSSLMKARADAGLENVIINHEVDLVPGKYQLHMVPRPFTNAQEFSRSLRQPLGPEWNTALSFKEGNQPRITTIQGVAIDPLSLEAHAKKSKTQRRKVAPGKKTRIAGAKAAA